MSSSSNTAPSGSQAAPGAPAWLQQLRLPFVSASLMSVVYGGATAYHAAGAIHWLKFALCLVGVGLGQLASNVANDYFDHLSGNDEANANPTPFSGGSRVIQRGLMSPRAVLMEAIICFAAALAIGLYLNAVTPGNTVLWLGVAGFLIGFFYTASPVRLVYRGLGELAIAFAFGPLPVAGTQIVLMGRVDAAGIVGGIVLGLLVALILYANEIPDYPADRAVDKKTLPVLLGLRTSWVGHVIGFGSAFAVLAFGVAAGALPVSALIGLAALPLGVWAAVRIRRHPAEPQALIPACGLTILMHALAAVLLSAGVAFAA